MEPPLFQGTRLGGGSADPTPPSAALLPVTEFDFVEVAAVADDGCVVAATPVDGGLLFDEALLMLLFAMLLAEAEAILFVLFPPFNLESTNKQTIIRETENINKLSTLPSFMMCNDYLENIIPTQRFSK